MVKLHCLADICIIPIGTPTASVSDYVTACVNYVAQSGVKYTLHSAGTTLEGEWDEVMQLIGELHELCHNELEVVRVQTDIRVGTRIDKAQTAADKVRVVKEKLEARNSQ
ncbi:hypothetical protein BABINDRAFT_46193 [Babjeviella inositovora NRRL Y-12698]|uniref:Thiamine-binding protein domain-containing protein n=1 Tax=Babjeviella inositovora NRRL Y-12698 TaxID=984486 RepID=A0A1E3QWK0_9ASCO|nr:uncharacterized protein BABINDRAFT_46193 [Babjeviella inositovora NRRL Y-12698]ODQ82055.1 hypothetical protein BABINDRAFT_46193 [Babjeviella inositovora NRRL Y-12698]